MKFKLPYLETKKEWKEFAVVAIIFFTVMFLLRCFNNWACGGQVTPSNNPITRMKHEY